MTPEISRRTLARDVVVQTLTNRKGTEAVRLPDYAISLTWDEPSECTKWPTYCVVVSDETPVSQTQDKSDYAMQLIVVALVSDSKDPRAKLDAAIEDVHEAITAAFDQLKAGGFWKVLPDQITTDEGTRVAKPYGQAVLRWAFHHRRKTII